MQGAALETVVKIRNVDESDAADAPKKQADSDHGKQAEKGDNKKQSGEENGIMLDEVEEEKDVVKLVDSKDNQFVLAKGSDSTVPMEDHTLIKVCQTLPLYNNLDTVHGSTTGIHMSCV